MEFGAQRESEKEQISLTRSVKRSFLVGLTKDDLRKLDYIHVRCLRRILKIPAAFFSHISNEEILRRARAPSFSALVRRQQFKLLGHVLRRDNTHPDRKAVFAANSARERNPSDLGLHRRKGRPRKNWYSHVVPTCLQAFNLTPDQLSALAQDRIQWGISTERLCATL